jgi:glycosyltransferase involved in cell wall biosynthesis
MTQHGDAPARPSKGLRPRFMSSTIANPEPTHRLILINNTLGRGGVENVVRWIYETHRAQDLDLLVVVPRGCEITSIETNALVLVRKNPVSALIDMHRIIAASPLPTVVHVHHRKWALLTLLARTMLPAKRRPVIVEHVHNVFTDRRWLSFRSELLVAAGSGIARMLVQKYRKPASRIMILHNAAFNNPARSELPRPLNPQFKSPQSSDTRPGILYGIGRLVPEKAPEIWVEVARELISSGVLEGATWMGDGPMCHQLVDRTRDLPISWVGNVPDVRAIMRKEPGVLLVTSYREAMPLAILEALAIGVPVVARDVGSISDAVVTNQSGFLMPRGAAPQDFVDALQRMVDPQLYAELTVGSFNQYRENFTQERFQRDLNEVYVRAFTLLHRGIPSSLIREGTP